MAGSAQATATAPIPASSARRMTCTIIGRPAISASGLPGRRVDAMRAGMTTIGFKAALSLAIGAVQLRYAASRAQTAPARNGVPG